KDVNTIQNCDYSRHVTDKQANKENKDQRPLGKDGMIRNQYLKHHRKPISYPLLLPENLFPHLLEIDKTANRRMEQIMIELQKAQTPPDKMTDQMGWVGYMNNLKSQAEEIILKELIYN